MIRKDFIYRDDAGRVGLSAESKRAGDRIIGPQGVLLAERVIPEPRYSPPHLFSSKRELVVRRRLAYVYLKGIIFWAEENGRPATGRLRYKKLWPVLKDAFPGDMNADLEGLVDRILGNTLVKETDLPVIEERLVRADNFFVLGKRAWFSNRFHLYSGMLTDGKNFKGTVKKVVGVPRDDDPGTDYNHVIRCWVYQIDPSASGGYRMLTEERVMRSSGLRRAYENNRAIINEYVSDDLTSWTFNRTVGEDLRVDAKDPYKITPIPGLPVNYLPRLLEHTVSYGGTELTTDLSDRLEELYPQPGGVYMEKSAGGYRAYLSRFGFNTTWTSAGGVEWAQESTMNYVYTRQGDGIWSTSVLSLGRKV